MGQCLSIATQVLQAVATAESHEGGQNQQQQQQQQQKHDAPQHTTPSSTIPSTSTSSSSLSPIYSSLPPDAEKHTVRNVYDGDTLTLTDERRVRLLGIDTPEIKEHQPFAEEAKAYTKSKCYDNGRREIWISFERNHEKQDHYGRLLTFVWVQNNDSSGGGGYLNVNEGIVAAGLASAYIPNQQSKPHNWDKLIKLQSQARSQKLGRWSTTASGGFQHDKTVYKTANGSAFHNKDCEHLANIKHLTAMKQSEAMDKGLHACRTCLAS
jgi:micrococcal nuclease